MYCSEALSSGLDRTAVVTYIQLITGMAMKYTVTGLIVEGVGK